MSVIALGQDTFPLETSGSVVIASLALPSVITQHPTSLQRQRDLVEGNNLHTQPAPSPHFELCGSTACPV